VLLHAPTACFESALDVEDTQTTTSGSGSPTGTLALSGTTSSHPNPSSTDTMGSVGTTDAPSSATTAASESGADLASEGTGVATIVAASGNTGELAESGASTSNSASTSSTAASTTDESSEGTAGSTDCDLPNQPTGTVEPSVPLALLLGDFEGDPPARSAESPQTQNYWYGYSVHAVEFCRTDLPTALGGPGESTHTGVVTGVLEPVDASDNVYPHLAIGLNVGDVAAGETFDASRFEGVSFMARGTARVFFYVGVPALFLPDEYDGRGTCETMCYDHHGVFVDLTPHWQAYAIPFVDLEQRGFGMAWEFDPSGIMNVRWEAHADWNSGVDVIEVAVDNVGFYSATPGGD